MFRKQLSLTDKCLQFKENAKQFISKNKGSIVEMDLTVIEKFFGFTASDYITTWIPKLIREELTRNGVVLRKVRGRNYILVSIKED